VRVIFYFIFILLFSSFYIFEKTADLTLRCPQGLGAYWNGMRDNVIMTLVVNIKNGQNHINERNDFSSTDTHSVMEKSSTKVSM